MVESGALPGGIVVAHGAVSRKARTRMIRIGRPVEVSQVAARTLRRGTSIAGPVARGAFHARMTGG